MCHTMNFSLFMLHIIDRQLMEWAVFASRYAPVVFAGLVGWLRILESTAKLLRQVTCWTYATNLCSGLRDNSLCTRYYSRV